MNIMATPKSKFEKVVKKCAVSPLKCTATLGDWNSLFFYKLLNDDVATPAQIQ